MKEKKLTNISARIDVDVKNILEMESELNQTSFNALLNKILRRHVQWDRFTQEIGMIYVNKSAFRNILSKMDDADIKLIASSTCRSSLRDAVIFLKKEMNLQSVVETLDLWFSASGITYRHMPSDKGEKYIIQHDMGEKYSLYLQTAVSALFSEIGHVLTNVNSSDNNLIFEVIPTS